MASAKLRRRLITIPSYWLVASTFWLLSPVTLVAVLVRDLLHRSLALTRVWAFVGGYLLINLYGQLLLLLAWIGTLFGLWTRHRVAWAYAIQTHWAGLLFSLATWLWRLRWTVEGDEQVEPAPAIYLIRHVSILDTVLPSRFITGVHGIPLRYVVKRELLNEPCLDIAGHWLANHFVDRDPSDSSVELDAIVKLAAGLEPGEGLGIYPEGTRFAAAKRARVIERLEHENPELARAAEQLQHTLLPRPAGTLALLRGAPQCDVVIVGHHGLEGLADLRDLLAGGVLGRSIHVVFWRYAAGTLPGDDEARSAWLRARWAELDRWVGAREGESLGAKAGFGSVP